MPNARLSLIQNETGSNRGTGCRASIASWTAVAEAATAGDTAVGEDENRLPLSRVAELVLFSFCGYEANRASFLPTAICFANPLCSASVFCALRKV